MCCKCHKINSNGDESYIDSPDWIKNKKAIINTINKKDNKYFQYVVIVTSNHEKMKKDLQRIPKIKPFTNKFNWKEINFSSAKDDSEKFEKNNVTIAFNVSDAKKRRIYPANFSKHNSNCEKQVILLMIANGEKCKRSKILATEGRSEGQQWHYLALNTTVVFIAWIVFILL